MTAQAPEHMTRPEFAVSVRGYDRAQVDGYFGRVVEWLADAGHQVLAAERYRESLAREVADLRATIGVLEQRAGLPAPQSMNAFSERLGEVMESAVQAAHALQIGAEREAEERRESAAGEVERVVASAREESERIVEGARRAQRAIEGSVGQLHAARAQAVEMLGDLQRRIAALVGEAEPSSVGDGDADGDVDTGEPTIVQPAVVRGAGRNAAAARRNHSA
jgi:cell division septum initiation protein DivIVA